MKNYIVELYVYNKDSHDILQKYIGDFCYKRIYIGGTNTQIEHVYECPEYEMYDVGGVNDACVNFNALFDFLQKNHIRCECVVCEEKKFGKYGSFIDTEVICATIIK